MCKCQCLGFMCRWNDLQLCCCLLLIMQTHLFILEIIEWRGLEPDHTIFNVCHTNGSWTNTCSHLKSASSKLLTNGFPHQEGWHFLYRLTSSCFQPHAPCCLFSPASDVFPYLKVWCSKHPFSLLSNSSVGPFQTYLEQANMVADISPSCLEQLSG